MTSIFQFVTMRSDMISQLEAEAEGELEGKSAKDVTMAAEGNFSAVSIEFFNHTAYNVKDTMRFFLMILEKYPSFDYLLIKLPRLEQPPECVKYMIRANPRSHKKWSYYDEELYVFHRKVFTGITECRAAINADHKDILHILCLDQSPDVVQQEMFSAMFNPTIEKKTVVFTVNTKIVGAAIVCPIKDLEFYKFHYKLESVINPPLYGQSDVGYIKAMVVNKLHEDRVRDFIRNILQLMGWKCVFFARYPHHKQAKIYDFSLISGLRHFVPILPRKVPQYAPSILDRIPPHHMRNDYPQCALYLINYRLSFQRKNIHHTKIVIVGTGETGLSFLKHLIFRANSQTELFANLVVITKHKNQFSYPRKTEISHKERQQLAHEKAKTRGLCWLSIMKTRLLKKRNDKGRLGGPKTPTDRSMDSTFSDFFAYETTHKAIAEQMAPRQGQFDTKNLAKLGLETWATVIEGTMTKIHRGERFVELENKQLIPYDYLFLFCGKQFSTPQAQTKNIVFGKECKALYDMKTPWVERITLQPKNLFTVNSLSDATVALQYLKRLNPRAGQVVVYGSCIDCLSCIEGLMKFGLPANRITYVESELEAPYAIDYFNDPVVYKAMRKKLNEIGITHHYYYNFADWDYNTHLKTINKVSFESKSHIVTLKCLALFSFSPKGPSIETVLAYANCDLVYDGSLVIDSEFRTNDPFIFAAGPDTKYKRILHADHFFHKYYNSSEVGEEMAEKASRYIPNVPHRILPVRQYIVEFKKPIVISRVLPRDNHLLIVRRPGPIVPLEVLINQLDFGTILVTGSPHDETQPDYFRIILDNKHCVIDIVCYSSQPIDENNLVKLYGRHERMLNNLLHRYRNNSIADFYEYFKEPWSYLFYHDSFDSLMEDIQENLYKSLPGINMTFVDLIIDSLKRNNWNQIRSDTISLLKDIFDGSPLLKVEIDKKLDKFINEHKAHLPMMMNDDYRRVAEKLMATDSKQDYS